MAAVTATAMATMTTMGTAMERVMAMVPAMGSSCSLNNRNSNDQNTIKLPSCFPAVLRKLPLQL
jgi:hypothetical protein